MNHEELIRRAINDRLHDNYLYVYESDTWLRWNGVRWASIPKPEFRKAIGDWAHDNFALAYLGREDEKKFWASVCSYDNQQALVELAEGHLIRSVSEFDQNPLLLNCPNVTVNLATGETYRHRPGDLITRSAVVDYIPGFTNPDWDKALTALPVELHDWYQLRYGQAITGKMTNKIIFQIGNGDNGKSGILDTIRFTLGDSSQTERGYALLANRSVLSADTNSSGINSALASFEGVRVAVIEELADGHFLKTTALKDLADTATISARHPYQRQSAFPAMHSLFVNSNYLPSIGEVDDGTWRRLLLVNFPYKFAATDNPTELHREPDETLKERLRDGIEQRQACLAWLVEGAVRYHTAEGEKQFRDVPEYVRTSTRNWRAEADLIMLYIGK